MSEAAANNIIISSLTEAHRIVGEPGPTIESARAARVSVDGDGGAASASIVMSGVKSRTIERARPRSGVGLPAAEPRFRAACAGSRSASTRGPSTAPRG